MKIFHEEWPKIVAKAWSDPSFKKRLISNPKEVCKEYGIECRQGVDLKVNDRTDTVYYLNLPEKPEGELTESELKGIAAGAGTKGCILGSFK